MSIGGGASCGAATTGSSVMVTLRGRPRGLASAFGFAAPFGRPLRLGAASKDTSPELVANETVPGCSALRALRALQALPAAQTLLARSSAFPARAARVRGRVQVFALDDRDRVAHARVAGVAPREALYLSRGRHERAGRGEQSDMAAHRRLQPPQCWQRQSNAEVWLASALQQRCETVCSRARS